MTVRELENRLSARELSEWMAYYSVEPFGTQREDYRAGLIAATVANCAGAGKKRTLQPTDFIPIFVQEKQMSFIDRKQEQLRQMSIFKGLAGKNNE
tara:strand:- start:14266 stop:14553 length:288 start_codon:yes stop_codon:yes gene_type:complete